MVTPESQNSSPNTYATSTLDIKQHSFHLSRYSGCDLPSKDSIEATFSNESNKTVELNLQVSPAAGSSVTSLYSNESFKQNPAFDRDESNTKSLTRKVIKRSPYFQHKYDNEELSTNKNMGDLIGDHPVATVTSVRNGYPRNAIKKRKLLHPHNTLSESEAGDQIDISNGKVEGKFVCNSSHVDRYSGIAEKSIKKFASLISLFRYRGSRASGLRPPLKDVQNTYPVRSTVKPIDIGKYICVSSGVLLISGWDSRGCSTIRIGRWHACSPWLSDWMACIFLLGFGF